MIKKAFICTIIILFGIALSTVMAAAGDDTSGGAPSGIQVIAPDRDISTSNDTLLLRFTAPEGTKVTIQVFQNNSLVLSRENFVAVEDPIEIEVGALRRGWAEIRLRPRRNRIEITAEYTDGTTETIIRYIDLTDVRNMRRDIERRINEHLLNPVNKQ